MQKTWQTIYGCLKNNKVTVHSISRTYSSTAHFCAQVNHNLPNDTPIRLRNYQEECIQSVLSYLNKGHRRLGVSLATGSGKTVIFTQLIDRIKPSSLNASRTLILAHRRELVEQAARHCSNAYPEKSIDIEMGNLHASGNADITVASVKSITSGDRLQKLNPTLYKLILVDEAHHIVAASYMETLRHFGLANQEQTDNSPALVGVSATLSRFDGIRLSDAIDHVVYHRDYVDMIEDRWLSEVLFTTVKSKADISRVKTNALGDFQVGSLSEAINTSETNEITVRAWLARAKDRKSTLVFCVDLAHVVDLASTFRKHGVDARFITGDTPNQIRSQRLDAFKQQQFSVLLNCGVFTEGTDIPNIDCVLLARPTKSRNLLVQMIGRGMRLYPGKANCHVIDMVGSLDVGVVTTPTLFGLDPAETVKEAGIEQLKALREKGKDLEAMREQQVQRASSGSSRSEQVHKGHEITFTDYESVYDLIDDTSGERHIRGMSPLSWVMVDQRRYVLSNQKGDYLTIDGNNDSTPAFCVSYTKKLEASSSQAKKCPYSRPREIAKAETLSDAVHAADTFASKLFPRQFIAHSQVWRKDPATDGQLDFLNKLRDMDNQLQARDLTKGKAADMITKVIHGAKGRFAKLEGIKRRDVRAAEKANRITSMKQREQVKVGPLY